MKKMRKLPGVLPVLLVPLAAVLILVVFATAVANLESGRVSQGRRQLEESIRRSAVACYAAEGAYPPDLAYLEDHYGIQVDTKRYTVYYSIFAENLMPDITVLENAS